MPRMMAAFYDYSMRATEEACLRSWRSDLLKDISGRGFEVGSGTGASLPHYPDSVTSLVMSEPDPHMRKKLVSACEASGRGGLEVSDASIHALPMADGSFDFAVSMLVLCSVPDLESALGELFRVLRPGGRLVYMEHVAAAEGSKRFVWQRRIEPLWKRLAGNCHLTRRTEAALLAAGFEIEEIQRESMRKAMPLVRPTIRGLARKP